MVGPVVPRTALAYTDGRVLPALLSLQPEPGPTLLF